MAVLLSLVLESGGAGAQTPIAAPTIDSVTPADGSLSVAWTAPTGVTGITAYDLRYIESEAPDKADANWTEIEDIWTASSGDLAYTLSGLENGVGYDVQLRTVTTANGAWSGTSTGTPQIPGPVITPVVVGDGALTVVWTAPVVAATTAIGAYDVRYIESSAADKTDDQWTVVEGFWTSGSLHGVLAGLTNGTGYDVQVRAVAATDGAWSATATGTPAEHGGTLETATTLPLTTRMGGVIESGTDVDYFTLELTAATGIIVYTRGDLDTVGQLLDADGVLLSENDEGDELHGRHNFLLWGSLQAGTYYVKVTGSDGATGAYVLGTTTIADSTARSDAQDIEVGGFARGIIDLEETDKDWFRITLTAHTILLVHTTGPAHTSGDLWLSGSGRPPNVERFPVGGNIFFVRANLSPGTYYVEVDGYLDATGAYTLHVNRAAEPGSSTEAAEPLVPLFPKAGTISPADDVDYFRIELAQATHVVIGASGSAVAIAGELLDADANPVDANIFESRYRISAPVGFTLRDRLDAGTYYLKVTRLPGSSGPTSGRYGLRMWEDYVYGEFFDGCTALTASLSDPLSDPLSGCQWHLDNTGQLGGTPGEDINVREVWAAGHLGEGATVALVDNGFDAGHPDLAPNVLAERNYAYGDGSVFNPGNTHGTGAAGLIAARDNGIGVRGVAPRAQIYVYNLIDDYNHANAADAMTRGMETTAISNNSWSQTEGPGYAAAPTVWEMAVVRGVTEGYGGKGVLYVRSGGNDAVLGANSNLSGFRNHYTATAACAVTDRGVRSHYSEQGANLWVCAPSGASYLPAAITTTANFGRYRNNYGGTSSTAAIVSGVAALLRGAYTDLTWRDVKLILAGSARKNDPSNTGWEEGALRYGSATQRYTFNHEYGFGVVDAGEAMDLAAGWTSLPLFIEETQASGDISLAVPDLPSSGTPTTVTSSITMGPGVQFTEFVSIRLSLTAAWFRDLQIELESPSGEVSVLSPHYLVGSGECTSLFGIVPGQCDLDRFVRFGSAKHLGEDPGGVWTLRIADHVDGEAVARLNSWSLTVYGHRSTPAAPAIDSVEDGSESLTVTWTAPSNTGASDITAYDVRSIRSDVADKSHSEWTLVDNAWTSGDIEYTISGLTGNVQYDVQVRAVNASGDGLWSATATGTPTTDEAPTIDAVTPRDQSIAIAWTAPTNASLGTVSAYDLRYIRSDASSKADTHWTTVSSIWTVGSLDYTLNPTPSLVNGVSYDVQVRAVVGTDQQPWSGVRSATPRTTPGAPTIDSVTPGDGSLTPEWSPPQSDGGADITSYDVRHIRSDAADKSDDQWTVVDDAWSSASGALEYTVSGLTTDVQYDVQVRAANDAGDGLWSATGTGTPRTPPEAPESVHVYVYVTGKLEVRWSSADFDSVTAFKVQWRSGDQEWDASRSDEVDPATAQVQWSSTQDSRRYRHALDGLTNATEYEVRVLASNQGVDGSPSDVAAGTPQSDSTHDQAADFIENELISVHEDASPWLRVAFDWIDAANGEGDPYGVRSGIEFHLGEQFWGRVVHSCFNGAGAELHHTLWDRWSRYCHITWMYIEWDYIDVIPLITHELAHVLTLTNRLEGSPEVPLAIARLYFARVDHGCDYRPAREVLADLLMVSVFGDAGTQVSGYWRHCVGRDTEEALGVVNTALAGEVPAWLAETYGDENGDLDLELVWSHIKAEGDPSPIMRDLMRSAFGGLCRSDALWNNAIRIPWLDGGCVPTAPPGLTAVAAVDGVMALSWQSPDDDGGSRITGYKVRWKSGAQNYDTSREASLTDLADLSHTLEGLSHGIDYTIQILAYNINGDGAASEVTQTAVGSEAALESLTLAGTTLYPTFRSTTPSYAATTGHAATQITIAATAADADAGVAFLDVDGNALTDAAAADEFQVNLSVGANVIQVRVTAQDGVAAIYTVTVTRAEENTSLSPPASDPVAASPSSARYTITFQGSWTTDVTPGGLPGGAHFSPLIGAVHGAGVTFLVSGGAASAGVESMAEVGQTSQLRSEVNTAIDASPATALAVISRSGNISPTGSRALSNVELTTAFPRVTLTTMIAPSHDWFVGVSGFPLLNAQGEWLSWVRVFLYPWDAGTEEGEDFSLSPSVATTPRGEITSIRGTGRFTTERIASLTFTLQSISPSFPAAETGTRGVAENTASGQDIGEPVVATDPDSGDSLSYALGGPDAGSFAIVASTGQLRTRAALDHETASSYSVAVTATDTSGLSDTIDVTITVTNVEEAGVVSLWPVQPRVGTVLRASLSDPDGDVRSVFWRWQRSSDQTSWTGVSGSDASYTPTSADEGMYIRARATYADGEGSGKSADAESGQPVGAREDAPGITVVTLVSGLSIPWDLAFAPDGTMLLTERGGALKARLTDSTVQTVTADFSDLFVSGEAGLMAIVVDPGFASNRRFYTCQAHTGGAVEVIAWTMNSDYTAATRVADPLVGGIPGASIHDGCRLRFGPQGFLWIATGDAASGTVPQDLASLGGKVLRVDASTGAGAPGNPFAPSPRVYTHGHRNPQGLALRPGTNQMWSVEHGPTVDDEINLLTSGGNYGWDPAPGYDQSVPMTDLVKFPDAVEARWSSGDPTLATSGGIFLHGADWEEWNGRLAVATLKTRSLRIFEFTAAGTFVSQVVVPELDGTYGRLRTPMLGPGGALYLTTSNGGGADRILKVVPGRPPAFAAATETREVAENNSTSAVVATVTATDPDGERLTYTLGGVDAGVFAIPNPAAGGLRATVRFDHEARRSYEVVVTATDPYGLSDHVTLTITVTNVDEPADVSFAAAGGVSVSDNALAVAENFDGTLATFSASDPEQKAGLTYEWSVGGTDGGDFAITGAGVLSFVNIPDHERPADSGGNNVYDITVSALDSDGKTGSIALTVTVDPVNEPPAISGDAAPNIEEGGAVLVGTYRATDPESATIAWQPLAGSDSGRFDFNSSNGRLTFKTAPDFEDPERGGDNVYDVTLSASDGAHTITFDVAVSVTNREEPGMLALPATRPQAEADYSATLSDPDRVQSATWTWERSTSRSGPWAAVSGAADSTTTSVYTPVTTDVGYYLRATAAYTDGHGPNKSLVAVSSSAVVAAPAVNNPPTFEEANPTRSIAENARANAPVGERVTATDPDQGNTVGYEFDPASDLFTIDGATGQIRVKEAASLDHETAPSHTVTVKASDSSNAFDTVQVTITVTDVNEPPDAVADTSTVSEDGAVTVDVLANDSDPEDERSELLLTVVTAPLNGRASVNEPANVGDRRTITYEPHADYHGADTFTYRARDSASPSLSNTATVSVQVDPVNDPPTFASPTTTRSVSESAEAGDNVGAPVTATDIDENDTLTYSLSGPDAFSFVIDAAGQIAVGTGVTFDASTTSEYAVTVEARDRADASATIDVTVAVTVTAGPAIGGGGFVGGGGGGPSGPSPSSVEFEWTVKHDIESLDSSHDSPTGSWSNGSILWLLENGDGADDAVYAYDLNTGERVEEREFELDERNRAPRGVWSDGKIKILWVSDSGQNKLFAHDLESGERLAERDIELAARNRQARGIWSDGERMYVLDGGKDSVFVYDLESGELLVECALDAANNDPRGIWSDGVTVWVSDHGAKRLFAYRLPVLSGEPDAGEEDEGDKELERVRDEEFGQSRELTKASNNSPRGIWSDGDLMYVADASDGKVYSYNMPDAIDARLASLTLSDIAIGEFSSARPEYEGVVAEGATVTTVEAAAVQSGTDIAIDPPDGDEEADGHQVALDGVSEITVTVTSADGSREKTYRVTFGEAEQESTPEPWAHCLRGDISEGFSLLLYEGGSVEDLVACAESRGVTAVYALHEGVYVSYIPGAPPSVNAGFAGLFAGGVPPFTPLTVKSNGPPSADPNAGDGALLPGTECLRGEIAVGFSLVVYQGGSSVAELVACAQRLHVAALYALHDGEWVSYILGAPEWVNEGFAELFPDGIPPITPLVARSAGPPEAN